MAEVVAHTATTLHNLYLLLIYLHYAAIRVAVAAVADDETVGKRHHLEVVAYARHRTALRDDVAEVLEQAVDLFLAHRVWVLALNTCKLRCDAAMHHIGVLLVDFVAVTQRVLVHPYIGSQFVTVKIIHRRFHNLIRGVLFVRFLLCFVHFRCTDFRLFFYFF